MTANMLLWTILVPAITALVLLLLPGRIKLVRELMAMAAAGVSLYLAVALFLAKNLTWRVPWLGKEISFDLRLYHFSSFILLSLAVFLVLIALYSTIKMKDHPHVRQYYVYVFLSAALANGAVLSDNFVVLVFFWEGLLLTLYGLISIGGKDSHRTALKAFMISGVCDFCMILGIGLLWTATGTLTISAVSIRPEGITAGAFILMMIGALGKAGAMPFHTWIPDAAVDAPVAFMAFMPGAFEKLLGIYLLARLTLDVFPIETGSAMSILLMTIGAATIVLAVMMALIQKDFKRLLSFHAVSQVGYMVLGIGTGVAAGIAGGLFHMLNNAIYKSGLFMCAGAVEHRCGTTDMRKLGGLAKAMPLTTIGFTVCALAISGVWPLNGFVSKEMVFHGALETGYTVFAAAAWLGAIFTSASFLKAGHSIFFGKPSDARPAIEIKENSAALVAPILVLALLCILFGILNTFPLTQLIQPILAGRAEAGEHLDLSAHALDLFNPVAGISIACMLIAVGLHAYGWRKGGRKPYLASEPIHKAPVLRQVYDLAEKRVFDLYEQGVVFLRGLSMVLFRGIDRPIDAFFEKVITAAGSAASTVLRKAHTGHFANYLAWCLGGLVVIAAVISVLVK